MFSRHDARSTQSRTRRSPSAVIFEAVEDRRLFSAGFSSASQALSQVIAANAGTTKVTTPAIVQTASSQASSQVNKVRAPQGSEDLANAGLKNLVTANVGNHGLFSSLLTPTNGSTQQLPDQYSRQRSQLAGGVTQPTVTGAFGQLNAAVSTATTQVNAHRSSISTAITAGPSGARPGGAAARSVFAPQRTISDVKGMDFSTLKSSGKAGQQMSDPGQSSAVGSAMDTVGSILNIAGTALSVVDPVVGGAVSLGGDALILTGSGMTIAEGNQGDLALKVLGTEVTIIGWVAGAAGATAVAGVATGASAGLAAGNLINKAYTWAAGESLGDTWFSAFGNKGKPAPDSVDSSGSAPILVGMHRSGNTRAPLPGVDRPPEPGFGKFGGTPLGGAEDVVKEIKGVRTVRTPGQANPNLVNPAPDALPAAKRADLPPNNGLGMLGNPPPAGVR